VKKTATVSLIIGFCLWSILSLVLYRSNAGHGPDMVGEEVLRFVLPLLLAAVTSVVHLVMVRSAIKRMTLQAFLPLLAVVILAGVEIGIYSAYIVR
jgi:hypothetical protein